MGFKYGPERHDISPENSSVCLFRTRPDVDYVIFQTPDERYRAIFNATFAHWVGGIALSEIDQKELRTTERTMGTYRDKYGGNPRVIIDDDPDESELEMLGDYVIGDALDDDVHLYADLDKSAPKDTDGES